MSPKKQAETREKPRTEWKLDIFRHQCEVQVWIINGFSLDLDVRQHQIDILHVLVT